MNLYKSRSLHVVVMWPKVITQLSCSCFLFSQFLPKVRVYSCSVLRRAVRNVLSRSWPAKHDYSCRWTVNTRTWKYSSYRRWWNTRKDIPAWCTKQIYFQQLINIKNVFTFVISEKKGKKRGGVSSAIPLHPQKWKDSLWPSLPPHLSFSTYLFTSARFYLKN